MADSDEDLDRSSRPDAEDQRWLSTGRILDGQTIGRSVNGLHQTILPLLYRFHSIMP
jgi:hypothetical protein